MRTPCRTASLTVVAVLSLLGAAPAVAPPARPAPDKGAPELALLKREEGVWNATIQMAPEPGADAEISNGVETNVMGPGGMWLITDFKGQLMGRPFQGHGILGFDAQKKKYIRVWVDSTQAVLFPAIGAYDPATSTLAMWMEGPDTSGHPARWRTTLIWKDNDTKVYTMYAPGPETTEATTMIITYKRRR